MKRYECHKIVEAGLISTTNPVRGHVVLNTGEIVQVPADWFSRMRPGEGYLVKYEDGYFSWSPKQAFENGYTEIIDG